MRLGVGSTGAATAWMVASAAEIPKRPAGRSIASSCLVRLRTVICNLLQFDAAENYHRVWRRSTSFFEGRLDGNIATVVHYLVRHLASIESTGETCGAEPC